MNAELVRGLLKYDPQTGVFLWREGTKLCGAQAGTRDRDGYVVIRHGGKGFKAHRLAWLYMHGCLPSGVIDHINHDRADNRLANLRDVTPQTNSAHLRPDRPWGVSGIRNVSWFAQYGKWKAAYMHAGRKVFVGYFQTPAEANAAVLRARAAAEHHG